MVDPFGTDPMPTLGAGAERAKNDLNERFQDLRHDAEKTANQTVGGASQRVDEATGSFRGSAERQTSSATAGDFRAQASQAAGEAKSAASSIAEQARSRFSEIVDQQKAAGADKIAGVAKAAQSAAGDLEKTNPQMARLVRTAAQSVDKVAEDVRSSDIGEAFDTLAAFGRQQPVAFFGGAVLAGFLLARFFKSDAPIVSNDARYRAAV